MARRDGYLASEGMEQSKGSEEDDYGCGKGGKSTKLKSCPTSTVAVYGQDKGTGKAAGKDKGTGTADGKDKGTGKAAGQGKGKGKGTGKAAGKVAAAAGASTAAWAVYELVKNAREHAGRLEDELQVIEDRLETFL
jgi:hypothetical protein